MAKSPAKLSRTASALLTRGVDLVTAEALHQANWTLAKLQQQPESRLIDLGISSTTAANILSGDRPAIPFSSLARVLTSNRMTCCVCHEVERSVIIHHIQDWAVSHDHSLSNLAVLCLDHHDKAHKRGGLTQNLTPNLIREFKNSWEAEVAKFDTRAILAASAIDSDSWWLFNHQRLFALTQDLGIDLKSLHSYPAAFRLKCADAGGFLLDRNKCEHYLYAGGSGLALYAYMKDILDAALTRLTVMNISDSLDRRLLKAVLKPGDFVFLQGAYTFGSKSKAEAKPGQTIRGVRRANRVGLCFTADRWEATSNSAWGAWLRGRQNAACLCRVMNVSKDGDALIIETTAFAIGAALEGLKRREYSSPPYQRGYILDEEDADEFDTNWERQ